MGEPLATFWFQIKSKVRYKHSKTTRFCIVCTSRCLLSNWSVSRHIWFGVIMVHQHIIWMVTRIRPISFTKIIIQLKENILARYFLYILQIRLLRILGDILEKSYRTQQYKQKYLKISEEVQVFPKKNPSETSPHKHKPTQNDLRKDWKQLSLFQGNWNSSTE